jgi:hypothetical protein
VTSHPATSHLPELRELADRLATLTRAALTACQEHNADSLAELLKAREAIIQRVGEISAQISTTSEGLASMPPISNASLATIGDAFQEALQLNGQLQAKAGTARAAIGAELDQLRMDEAAQHAYGAPTQRASGINLVR